MASSETPARSSRNPSVSGVAVSGTKAGSGSVTRNPKRRAMS